MIHISQEGECEQSGGYKIRQDFHCQLTEMKMAAVKSDIYHTACSNDLECFFIPNYFALV